MKNDFAKQWYAESKVQEVYTPDVATWRSRYDLKEQLLLTNNDFVIRNMRRTDLYPYKSSDDLEHIVEARENCRPDIIAEEAYGDPRLAWVILSANNLSDLFDLRTGMRIRIPSSISLYSSGGVMNRWVIFIIKKEKV